MKGFKAAIESEAIENTNFRKVLYTSEYCQLVLMSLLPNEEIGIETHQANDQFFRVEKGRGKCIIDGSECEIRDGDAVVVPRGARHNVINLSATEALKLYTIYSPPHHKDGVVRATRMDAETNEEEFDGITTEGARSGNGS
jgi:mannose-6-phosphate isomerase-like protein (cupin superfamily)